MSRYDREADIAFLDLEPFDGRQTVGEDFAWGLIIRDRESGRVVGLEFWRASVRLPTELLAALPEPKAKGVTVARKPARAPVVSQQP